MKVIRYFWQRQKSKDLQNYTVLIKLNYLKNVDDTILIYKSKEKIKKNGVAVRLSQTKNGQTK